jgi:hypothetical protein
VKDNGTDSEHKETRNLPAFDGVLVAELKALNRLADEPEVVWPGCSYRHRSGQVSKTLFISSGNLSRPASSLAARATYLHIGSDLVGRMNRRPAWSPGIPQARFQLLEHEPWSVEVGAQSRVDMEVVNIQLFARRPAPV